MIHIDSFDTPVRRALRTEAAKKALKGLQGHGAYTEKCNENFLVTDTSKMWSIFDGLSQDKLSIIPESP